MGAPSSWPPSPRLSAHPGWPPALTCRHRLPVGADSPGGSHGGSGRSAYAEGLRIPVEGVSIFFPFRSLVLASAIFTFVRQKVFLQTQPRWQQQPALRTLLLFRGLTGVRLDHYRPVEAWGEGREAPILPAPAPGGSCPEDLDEALSSLGTVAPSPARGLELPGTGSAQPTVSPAQSRAGQAFTGLS